MTLAAIDAADRVQQLIALTEQLTGRLAEEAALFEARRPQDAAAGLEETGRLANLYRHESMRVKANPDLVAGAPKALRLQLVEVTRAFETMLERHSHALAAAKAITEGLVQTVAREVASARAAGTGYGPGARATVGDSRAVALNKQA
ncbi:flagellar basal body protein [Caulobacter sp. 17J65-9]|uniref:flagellar basal body protein n=1 Tax=Caulobacter sp. 17J65-9 TaxID=2709382 RepID=UPI0013C7EAF1|nr:flagellar basal body protein [Caulobacter sp. 17J65-9]